MALGEYLEFCDLRGCSDFLFVPGSNDCHIFVIRTEETLEGVLSTYASVIDLEGKVLMPEAVFQTERKFEGVAEVTEAFWEALVKSAAAEGVTP